MDTATLDRDHLASIILTSNDAIITKSLDGTVLTWNPAAVQMFGYRTDEMVGHKMLKLFPPERASEEDIILAKLAQGERIEHFRTQRVCKDGRRIEISVSISPIFDSNGKVVAASKIARDITAQIHADQQIAQYKALIDSSDDAIISKDRQGIIRTWNLGAQRIFGYTSNEVLGQHISLLFPQERLHEEEKLLKTVLSGEPVRHFRTTRLTKNGQRIFASISISAIKNDGDEIIGFSKIVRDLTQEIQQEQSLWQAVHFDSLTGVMSRVGIKSAVDDLIRVSQIRQRSLALVRCNIDGFAKINAECSPMVGDQLLVRIAQSLKDSVRESDDIARIHSDNFVVVLQGFNQIDSVPKAVKKIKAAIESITEIAGHPMAISVSLGVAVYPEDGQTYATLVKNAEHSIQSARMKGQGASRFFSQLDRSNLPEDFFLVQALKNAAEHQQLHLEYQPILDAVTQRTSKVEALLRWEHPELGKISPAVFIPLAEKYGLIRDISKWVLRQAMKDLTRWTDLFGLGFQVSINRSAHDFYDYEESHQEMREALHEFGLCGNNLIIEVTEHSFLGNTDLTEKILKNYRTLGIQIALDDFGTGYSSLDYLKRYPVDYLKIDKSFIDDLEYNSVHFQLCDGIISIAKRLGLRVVAEGVETELQAEILKGMNAEFIQGYLYSKPLRAHDLEAWILANTKPSHEIAP